MKHLFTFLLTLLIAGAYSVYAQTPATGKIKGKVTMVDGQPLESASVSITSLQKTEAVS